MVDEVLDVCRLNKQDAVERWSNKTIRVTYF